MTKKLVLQDLCSKLFQKAVACFSTFSTYKITCHLRIETLSWVFSDFSHCYKLLHLCSPPCFVSLSAAGPRCFNITSMTAYGASVIAGGQTGRRRNSNQFHYSIFFCKRTSVLLPLKNYRSDFQWKVRGTELPGSSEVGDWQTVSLFLGRWSPKFAVSG